MNNRNESHAVIDAAIEIQKIREERSIRRRQGRSYRSKLDPHRAELISLYDAGASFEELAFWLLHSKKLTIHPTSIMRYMYKQPELKHRNG